MKQICIHCGRKSTGGSLWCQESYCSIDNMVTVFDYGETVGDLNIVKLLTVLRTSSIYEAERQGQKVLLKIAHAGFQERLKREAAFLMQLQVNKQFHPMLPILLPAHKQANLREHPIGKTVSHEQTLYYTIFDYAEGDFLRGILLKNPQPWYQHAGWITISLADVIALMHKNQILHLCLCPEIVFIRFDKEGIPRPILMDLGAVSEPQNVARYWDPRFVPAAYAAPELIRKSGGSVGASTDVYGLNLLLYEMLSGQPAFAYRLRADEDIYHDVLQAKPAPMNRADLQTVPEIAARGINQSYQARQPDVLTLAHELLATFPPVPKEKKGRRINWRTVAIVIATAFVVTLLIAMALALSEAATAVI